MHNCPYCPAMFETRDELVDHLFGEAGHDAGAKVLNGEVGL